MSHQLLSHQPPSRQTGITLIELMIVVIVVAVLAGVALPAYENNMLKARRADAYASLMDIASRQEQNMLDRAVYTFDLNDLGYADRIGGAVDTILSEEEHYDVSVEACTGSLAGPSCYVLVATAREDGGQVKDDGCNLIIFTSTGQKLSLPDGKTYPANVGEAAEDGRCW